MSGSLVCIGWKQPASWAGQNTKLFSPLSRWELNPTSFCLIENIEQTCMLTTTMGWLLCITMWIQMLIFGPPATTPHWLPRQNKDSEKLLLWLVIVEQTDVPFENLGGDTRLLYLMTI
jgi:hypothetical protein